MKFLIIFFIVPATVFAISLLAALLTHRGGRHQWEDSIMLAGSSAAGAAGVLTVLLWLTGFILLLS